MLEVFIHKKEDIDTENEQVPHRADLMSQDLAFDFDQLVHKTSLKYNVSHGVSLGPPRFYKHLGKSSYLKNKDPKMLGVFIFKYRSLSTKLILALHQRAR